jgi:hypothetical protein
MAQAVGAMSDLIRSGPSNQACNDVLHRAHQQGRTATSPEDRDLGRRDRLLFEHLAESAADRGLRQHLTFFEALAVRYPDRVLALSRRTTSPRHKAATSPTRNWVCLQRHGG